MTVRDAVGLVAAGAGICVPLAVLWLRRRALGEHVAAARAVSSEERERLRQRGRRSTWLFAATLAGGLALVLVVSSRSVPRVLAGAGLAVVVLSAVGSIACHLRIRCPVCRYRLGYQQPLGVPGRCERCATRLRR